MAQGLSAPPLTHEEFVSLRDCAKGVVHHLIPVEHKERLIKLALQLPTCFEMRTLSGGLVSSAPE
jgi:hypothetical protein